MINMTVRKLKKMRKYRGSSTHGGGAKKKRRGGGSRGGRGFSGGHKHKWSLIVTKQPEHYGYKGSHSLRNKKKAINIDELLKLTTDREIDLAKLGYDKLLSRGSISKAMTIKTLFCSEKAKQKIEAAGGKIVTN